MSGKIIKSKKAITPLGKLLEKKRIPVKETVFAGDIDDFEDFLDKELEKITGIPSGFWARRKNEKH